MARAAVNVYLTGRPGVDYLGVASPARLATNSPLRRSLAVTTKRW